MNKWQKIMFLVALSAMTSSVALATNKVEYKDVEQAKPLPPMNLTIKEYQPTQGPLTNRQLYISPLANKDAKQLYHDSEWRTWAWDSKSDEVKLNFVALYYHKNIAKPQVAVAGENESELAAHFLKRVKAEDRKNDMIIYVAVPFGVAKRAVKITDINLCGRVLDVTVGTTKGAKAVQKEDFQYVDSLVLPRFGNMRIRFVDTKGNCLAVLDTALDK